VAVAARKAAAAQAATAAAAKQAKKAKKAKKAKNARPAAAETAEAVAARLLHRERCRRYGASNLRMGLLKVRLVFSSAAPPAWPH
jgi:hypothetical protein